MQELCEVSGVTATLGPKGARHRFKEFYLHTRWSTDCIRS